MGNESSSSERETDQEIKDRQNQELAEERKERQERLGHDIRDVQEDPREKTFETDSQPEPSVTDKLENQERSGS